jgi:hypothetical protein
MPSNESKYFHVHINRLLAPTTRYRCDDHNLIQYKLWLPADSLCTPADTMYLKKSIYAKHSQIIAEFYEKLDTTRFEIEPSMSSRDIFVRDPFLSNIITPTPSAKRFVGCTQVPRFTSLKNESTDRSSPEVQHTTRRYMLPLLHSGTIHSVDVNRQ